MAIAVVAAEGGRLVFVRPEAPLAPTTSYTLVVDGARDAAGAPVPFALVGFTTCAPEESPVSSGIQ